MYSTPRPIVSSVRVGVGGDDPAADAGPYAGDQVSDLAGSNDADRPSVEMEPQQAFQREVPVRTRLWARWHFRSRARIIPTVNSSTAFGE